MSHTPLTAHMPPSWDCVTQVESTSIQHIEQNGQHFSDGIFKHIFLKEPFCILTQISLKFIHKNQIHNNSALVRIMAWGQTSDRPLTKPMSTQTYDGTVYTLGKNELNTYFEGYNICLQKNHTGQQLKESIIMTFYLKFSIHMIWVPG